MSLFTPDVSFYSAYLDRGKYLLTYRLSLLFMIVFFALTLNGLFFDVQSSIFYALVFTVASGGFVYLIRTKKYQPIYWVYTVAASILDMLALNTPSHVPHFAEFCWVFSIIIFAFIGLGRKAVMYFLFFLVSGIGYFVFFNSNNELIHAKPMGIFGQFGMWLEILFALFSVVYLLHQYSLFQSYGETQLRLANDELAYQNKIIQRKNKENSTLLKEIHHRVKNNLQIVISLLRMQREQVKSPETKSDFTEAINRIHSMSLIHQQLYRERELSNIEVHSYFSELIGSLLRSYLGADRKVEVSCAIDVKELSLETIVPLGLLMNELVTNSVKHAFIDPEKVYKLILEIKTWGDEGVILTYSDSGSWTQDAYAEASFGQELIEVLTEQLNGKLSRSDSTFELVIPKLGD
jgi:two-component sensor histidine kinase